MTIHHVQARHCGQHHGIVLRLLRPMGVIVGVAFLGRCFGLLVVVLSRVDLEEPLACYRHHQRVARCLALLDGHQVTHRQVKFANVMVEDGLTLRPVVFLEDGQRQLVVVDGQVMLVLNVVVVADSAVGT